MSTGIGPLHPAKAKRADDHHNGVMEAMEMDENEFDKHIGEWADIGRKSKDGGVYFIHARLVAVSPTHLFFQAPGAGVEAINLSEIARIQFKPSNTAPAASEGRRS